MTSLSVAFVQQQNTENKQENLQKSLASIADAKSHGAELVLLPELHSSLYFCQTESTQPFQLSESLNGETAEALSHAAKTQNIVVVGSIFEQRAPGIYHNTALVFDRDGSLAGIYRKMHIPDDPGYYEKYYFTPGDLGFQPITTSIGKLGVLVCWDQWYPEAARLMAMAGADILLYPTAIGWDPSDSKEQHAAQLDAWQTMQRAHSIANHLPVISCNRVGFEASPEATDPGQQFWGHSFITDGQGQVLAQANTQDSSVQVATIDKSQTEQLRQIWPFFRDRRIDAYQDLVKCWR